MALATLPKRKISFFSVLFTFFIDNLGWSIVFPIFAPLFLDPQNVIFSSEVSLATRTTVLGVFLAAFPIAQFFGAPILGELADRFGRRKALVVSIFLTFIGYVLNAWSIKEGFLILLFFSRIITGLFSGNLSICLAAISDLSLDVKAKAKNFAYLSALGGFSFIVGAFLGGKFSDKAISSYFTLALPLWIAAALSFINLLFIILAFEETYEPHPEMRFDFLESVHNIQDALKTKKIKTIYLIYFLFIFAWTLLFQFTPVLVIRKFNFMNSQIGDLAAFMGICWVLGSFIMNKFLVKRFSQLKILELCLILFTAFCILAPFSFYSLVLIAILGFAVFISGIGWPICLAVISNRATRNIQGKILGMSQSVQSLAMATSPIIGGVVYHIYTPFPFFLAGLATFIAGIVYFKVKI